MNAILIVKKEPGMDHFGHDAMANTLCICDCVLKDKKDGDKVKATIEGTLMEHEGKRYISVDKVDGEDVEDMELPGEYQDEEPMDTGGVPDHALMNSGDALMQFMKQVKGK